MTLSQPRPRLPVCVEGNVRRSVVICRAQASGGAPHIAEPAARGRRRGGHRASWGKVGLEHLQPHRRRHDDRREDGTSGTHAEERRQRLPEGARPDRAAAPDGVRGLTGAARHERSESRITHRNGYRERGLDTRLGSLELRIPKLRQGSYFPCFLEPRKTAEQALVAVIQEAWIKGISTRKIDDLVQTMGLSGISKSQVSKLCKDIDERVH